MKKKFKCSYGNYLKIKEEVENCKIEDIEKLTFESEKNVKSLKAMQKIAELIFVPLNIATLILIIDHIKQGKLWGCMIAIAMTILEIAIIVVMYYKTEKTVWYSEKVLEILKDRKNNN